MDEFQKHYIKQRSQTPKSTSYMIPYM
jgi:hypothetical protein